MRPARQSDRQASVQVWDKFVRLFHWSLAAVFCSNWLNEGGDTPHRYLGYIAVSLVLARVGWGFIGSPNARFSDWVPTPGQLWIYLGQLLHGREPRHIGHNPAAAVMMLLLLLCAICLGFTGWLSSTDRFFGEEWLEELHKLLANVTLGLVMIHIAAAIFESWRHRENLVLSMITGKKRANGEIDNADSTD